MFRRVALVIGILLYSPSFSNDTFADRSLRSRSSWTGQVAATPISTTESDESSISSSLSTEQCSQNSFRTHNSYLLHTYSKQAIKEKPGCPGWYLCEPGTVCINGKRYICQPGTYYNNNEVHRKEIIDNFDVGNRVDYDDDALSFVRCIPCAAGYRCKPYRDPVTNLVVGSSSSTQYPCVDPEIGSSSFLPSAYYCPEGSSTTHIVEPGYYTPSEENPFHRTQQWPCTPGYYCIDGLKFPCPPGTYGSDYGLSSPECSGLCDEGHYCTGAAISSRQYLCSSSTTEYICPRGSGFPLALGLPVNSLYSDDNDAVSLSSDNDEHILAPDNTQSSSSQLLPEELNSLDYTSIHLIRQTVQDTTTIVKEGRNLGMEYTTKGTLATGNQPLDGFTSTIGTGSLGSSSASIITDTMATGIHDDTSTYSIITHQTLSSSLMDSTKDDNSERTVRSRIKQRICPLGFWCSKEGIPYPCPSGRAGTRTGEYRPTCDTECEAGYYCTAGSTSKTQHECGGSHVYCPKGSSLPTIVSKGYYTIGIGGDSLTVKTPNQIRTNQTICTEGYYCINGEAFPCPAGRYGATKGLSSPLCSGPCLSGYYCPEASTSSTEIPCGGSEFYCPIGSAVPLAVSPGYYTAKVFVGSDLRLPLSNGNRATKSEEGAIPLGSVRSDTVTNAAYAPPLRTELASEYIYNQFVLETTKLASSTVQLTTEQLTTARLLHPQSERVQYLPSNLLPFLPTEELWTLLTDNLRPTEDKQAYYSTLSPPNSLTPDEELSRALESSSRPGIYSSRYILHSFDTTTVTELTRNMQIMCELGFWCDKGQRYECKAGTYGNTAGNTDAQCSGACSAGYYCPNASTSSTEIPCGGIHVYCPSSSAVPLPVTDGYYTLINDTMDYVNLREGYGEPGLETLINTSIAIYGTNIRTMQKRCPKGTYCRGGVAVVCPAGVYGIEKGAINSQCTGICEEGFYCPSGSVFPRQHKCGNETYFCPPGSGQPNRVTEGFYTAGGRTERNGGRISSLIPILICDANYSRHYELQIPAAARPEYPSSVCVAAHTVASSSSSLSLLSSVDPSVVPNTMIPVTNLITDTETYPSPQAIYAKGTVILPQDLLPEYCNVPRSPLLGPTNVSFLRWRYCYGTTLGDTDTRSYQRRCPPGTFCWYGLIMECPPGYYGVSAGETDFTCTGECPPGYYCPWNTVNYTLFPCGNANVYCPMRSGAPTPVDIGYYTHPDEPENLKTQQFICEPGFYCVKGKRYPCQAGIFGGQYGLSSPECSGPCSPGYFCPTNSSSPTQIECGIHRKAGVYCPTGSAKPLLVSPGSYTVGGFERIIGVSENSTRSAQIPCPIGHYCEQGIKYQCPGGTYGAIQGLATPECSGKCSRGHFCPPGSISSVEYRCGDLYLFLVDILSAIFAQAGIQENPYNNSDRVPLLSPYYNYSLYYSLYSHLANGTALENGLYGTTFTGVWKIRVEELNYLPKFQGESGNFTNRTTNSSDTWIPPVRCGYGNSSNLPNASLLDNCTVLDIGMEWNKQLDPSQITNKTYGTVQMAKDNTIILQITGVGPTNWTNNNTQGVWGSTGYGLIDDLTVNALNHTVLNFTVSIPWRAGIRFRIPPVVVPLPSFSAIMRHVLQGGPSSIYCPEGSEWPLSAPLGYVTNTSDDSYGIDPHPPTNFTRDSIYRIRPGSYSIAGIEYPCPPGYYGSSSGLSVRTCSGWCPAGYACPLGSIDPLPCPDNTYSTGGNQECIPCPVPSSGDNNRNVFTTSVPLPDDNLNSIDTIEQYYMQQEETTYRTQEILNNHDAENTWPRIVSDTVDRNNGLPLSPPLNRCRDSRDCCGLV